MLNVLSLFAGIGGIDLGFERAGMRVVGQVELDPLRREVLARHWPGVPRHDNVETAVAWWGSRRRPPVDVVCGGFPCQPFSMSGRKRGVCDERWKWPAMRDVIRAVRPSYVVVENVPALVRSEAFGVILGDLAGMRFDAEWSLLPACAVGFPHVRRRLFLVAVPGGLVRDPRVAAAGERGEAVQPVGGRQYAARRDPHRLLPAVPYHRRDLDGSAPGLVAAAGDAVVPAVAEYVGRLVVDLHTKGRTREPARPDPP